MILIFTDKILDHRTYHLNLFFNEDWESKYRIISYGHDIEASWLLHEAAIELGNNEILQKVEPLVQKIAIAAEDGLLANGSLIYEYHPDEKKADTDLHWWVQAENVVGHFNLYQHFGDEPALGTAYTCWKFIQRYLIDKEQGEWHWSVSLDHEINRRMTRPVSGNVPITTDGCVWRLSNDLPANSRPKDRLPALFYQINNRRKFPTSKKTSDMNKFYWMAIGLLLGLVNLRAEIKLPALVGDNMVLQQATKVRLWGNATPNSSLKVRSSWDNTEYTAQVNDQGRWEIWVQTPSASFEKQQLH